MAGDAVREVRRHFDVSPWAVREARQFLAATVGDRAGQELTEALALILSELTTNAVRHAGTDFDVVIGIDGHVRIEVEDGSTDLPIPRVAPEMALTGVDSRSSISSATGGASTSCGTASACGANETSP